MTDDVRDVLFDHFWQRGYGEWADEQTSQHERMGLNRRTCNDAICRSVQAKTDALSPVVAELCQAYYEAGLVEGSMIGSPDVVEVRELGL